MTSSIQERINTAQKLANEEKFEECVTVFSEIFNEDPKSPAALVALGEIMVDLGNIDGGLALMADSIDISNPDVNLLKSMANLLRGQDRLSEAADLLFCALNQAPDDQELRVETRELFHALDRDNEFKEAFETPAQNGAGGEAVH